MPNLGQLVSEVQSNLQGYTLRQDRITWLATTGGISATDLVIKIGSADNLAKGEANARLNEQLSELTKQFKELQGNVQSGKHQQLEDQGEYKILVAELRETIKQLVLQPVLAGGVVTVLAPLAVMTWGLQTWAVLCLAITLLLAGGGLLLARLPTAASGSH
jgi:hypothetical protein